MPEVSILVAIGVHNLYVSWRARYAAAAVVGLAGLFLGIAITFAGVSPFVRIVLYVALFLTGLFMVWVARHEPVATRLRELPAGQRAVMAYILGLGVLGAIVVAVAR